MLFGLTGCKINLSIFGSGTVQTQSGTINCTSDGTTQSGDCTQTYNVDANNVACTPGDPNCTVVTASQDVQETLVPTAPQDNTFKGFDGGCIGAGPCTLDISKDDADHAQDVAIEAHFEEDAPPSTATYTYNYLNQRQGKTVNGTTTYYVYDEQGHLLSELDASGNSIKDYVYMDGEYVAHVEQTGDTANGETKEQVFYPLNDHLGQPIMMLRADEKLAHEQYTDPYGKAYASYTDTSIGTGPTSQNIRLPGQYADDETGYSYNWNRYFDPTTANYLQSDLVGQQGDINTYLYAGANPVMNTDSKGLATQCDIKIALDVIRNFAPTLFIVQPASITPVAHLTNWYGKSVQGYTDPKNNIEINADDYGDTNTPVDDFVSPQFITTIAHEWQHVQESTWEKELSHGDTHAMIEKRADVIGFSTYRIFLAKRKIECKDCPK